MNNKMRLKYALIIIPVFLLLIGPTRSFPADEPVEIKISLVANQLQSTYYWATAFKGYLNQYAAGKFNVRIYHSSQLGSHEDNVNNSMSGSIQLGQTSTGGISNFVPEVGVFDLPYLFNDFVEVWAITDMDGPIMEEINQKALKKLGVRLFGVIDVGDFRSFSTTKKPVHNVNDLAGLKMRIVSSRVMIETAKTMGFSGTPIPWAEIYTSLQTGVVDGALNPIENLVSINLQELMKYGTLDRMMPLLDLIWLNEKFFQSFPVKTQKVLYNAARYANIATRGVNQENIRKSEEKWLAAGCKIIYLSAEEKEGFVKKAQPVYSWYREKMSADWLEKVLSALKKARER
jgi:TRAP-type C4-dicarboxylate transport system substrate-binding protein